tara:strand:- start:1744 stop:2619 length:876 start_codon:yes stop_codon:yes gene_type:complete
MQVSINEEAINISKFLGREITKSLSKKFNFDFDEAVKFLEFNSDNNRQDQTDQSTKKKSNVPLPFCGNINNAGCHGVRLNYGLYTQCTNSPTCFNGEYPMCQTCFKQSTNNSNNQPNYGFISKRAEMGVNYKDPKGKSPINYGNIMEKLNITRQQAEEAAEQAGLTIPDEQFAVVKAARGRPKKDATAYDTASEASVEEPKKRGRPKKNKDEVKEPEPIVEPEDSDDGEEMEAYAIKLDKSMDLGYIKQNQQKLDTDYLMTEDGSLYHPTNHQLIGIWDKTNKCVIVDSDD